jgi:hypothetical protein
MQLKKAINKAFLFLMEHRLFLPKGFHLSAEYTSNHQQILETAIYFLFYINHPQERQTLADNITKQQSLLNFLKFVVIIKIYLSTLRNASIEDAIEGKEEKHHG